LWALVGLQFLLLCAVAAFRPASQEVQTDASVPVTNRRLSYAALACWVLLFAVAFWLRVREIAVEPIHHDEVTCYAFTQGVLKWGFPGGQVDPDIPFGWCATSELTFYPTAICSFFVDDPRLVLRIPAMLFSMGTMALLAYMGWRWFNWRVAFVAAALF